MIQLKTLCFVNPNKLFVMQSVLVVSSTRGFK